MAQITYTIHPFDKAKAIAGALCIMIKGNHANSISTKVPVHDEWIDNADLKGAGICRFQSPNTFIFTVKGEVYSFREDGSAKSIEAVTGGWKLKLAEVQNGVTDVGTVVASTTQSAVMTRSGDEEATVSYGNVDKNIEGLTSRDQFALHALRGIMNHISDPSTLSNNEINYYCNAAYQWAANMMSAAANARATWEPSQGDIETRMEDVVGLETNTEKLLNNIMLSLQRTDEADNATGTWRKAGENPVTGAYTDAVARTLRHTGDTLCTSIQNAEEDGWRWSADVFSERTINPTLNALLNEYLSHTEGGTTTKYGLYDLIHAIQGISGGGGGGGSSSGQVTVTSMPAVDVGATGLGRDNDHPIYISGGGFPTRDALGATFAKNVLHDILTFNAAGAVGYTPITEIVSLIDDRIEAYLDSLEVVADSSKPSGYAIQYTAP